MTGRLLIDNSDAYLDFGVYVEDGDLRQLIQYPSFKTIESTDWPDEDGEEYDLTAPVLDTRTLQVSFCISNVRYAEDLFDCLSQGAYHDFYVPALGRTWKLRMTTNGSFSSHVTLGKLTLTFADDFPQVPTVSPLDFGESGVVQFGYELDGVDMSQFGAYILQGSNNDLRKAPQVKQNLTIKAKGSAGVIYDAQEVYFKPKDVTLNVLIKTSNVEDFWERYDALFAALLQPETRKFYVEETNAEYECFYNKQSVQSLHLLPDGGVWCQFSLTLKFVSCRPVNSYMFLATESDDWVVSEDDNMARIIIRPRSGITYLIMQSGEFIMTEDGNSRIYTNN